MVRRGAGLALLAAALGAAAGSARADPLRFTDEAGRPVSGLEVCFWFGPERECRRPAPGERLDWPPTATALRAEGDDHGPVWLEPAEQPPGGVVRVPRKADLTLERVPAGAAIDVYRVSDPAFRVPLSTLRVVDPKRPVRVPSGATVIAIGTPDHAPDLHRLDTAPGGATSVRYSPRAGWSAVVRTVDRVRRRPLPEAWVRLLATEPTAPAAEGRILATVRSDRDGLVLLSGIDAPMATVRAQHPDLAPRSARGLIAPAGGLLYQELDLRPGGAVSAQVRWLDRPAAGARCALFTAKNEDGAEIETSEAPPFLVTVAEDEGQCRFTHVPEGGYFLRVTPERAPGAADLWVEVADRRTVELAPDLHPLLIGGSVSRGGVPAVGYRVEARASGDRSSDRGPPALAPPATGAEALTDERGEFRLVVLVPGDYALVLRTPRGIRAATQRISVTSQGGYHDFTLLAQAVAGRVISSRGAPIAGAEVSLAWPEGPFTVVRQTVSDGDGSFEFFLSEPGEGYVRAEKDGFRPQSAEVAVGGGSPSAEADLVLAPLQRVRGRVVAADGSPLAGVWLASSLGPDEADPVFVGEAASAADGSFELPAEATAGGYSRVEPLRLYASGPGCPLTETRVPAPTPTPEPTDEGVPWERPEATIVCDTEPAVLRIHVAYSADHPLAGVSIRLRHDDGPPIPGQVLDAHLRVLGLRRITGADGELLLVLAPGRWEVLRSERLSFSPSSPGPEPTRLGTVALDPRTVTDLYVGAGER